MRLKIYNLVAFVALPLLCSAQESLTLERCREMAIETSSKLQSSQLKVLQSEDTYHAYRANNLPNFSLSAGYLYSTSTFSESIKGGYLPTFSPDATTGELKPNIVGMSPSGMPIFSSYAYMPDVNFDLEIGSVYSVGVNVAQPIYMGGKISSAVRLAEIGIDVARLEQTRTETEVVQDAEQAFFTYIKVGKMVEAAKAYNDVVDELHRTVENLLKGGMCTKNDLLRVEVKQGEAQMAMLKANNGLTLARMNLCYIIGLPMTTAELEVVDSFDAEQSVSAELDVTNRAEFTMLEKSVEAKELEVKLAQSDFLPSLTAMANYGYKNGVKLNGSALFDSPSLMAGVSLNVPLFHWGEGRRKVSAKRREVEMARNTQSDLVQKMTLELMRAINTYNEAQASVTLSERNVEQAAENLRQCTKRYTAGMETLATMLEAQALWQKAMTELTEAEATQRLAYVDYCRCKGKEND